jgi:hypothetical protein
MKKSLSSPVMISLEVDVAQDILKIIGGIIQHKYGFCHDEFSLIKQHITDKIQKSLTQKQEEK